jgi:hypothetical protein
MDSQDLAGEFRPTRRANNAVAWHIDKGALTLNEPRRYRDRAHLRFVSAQPCLICERRPSDAHHLRFAQQRALGRRVSDEYAVPLCRSHHRALHRHGDEPAWWEASKVDPVVVARELWQRTRLDGPAGGRAEALLSVGVMESTGRAGRSGPGHGSSDQTGNAPGSAGVLDEPMSTNRTPFGGAQPSRRRARLVDIAPDEVVGRHGQGES